MFVGGALVRWNPLSHTAYTRDARVVRAIAEEARALLTGEV